MKKENNNKNKLREKKRNLIDKKKNNFFVLLEDKLIEFGKVALKNGASVFIKNKIKEVEEKIEQEIKRKVLENLKIIFYNFYF